MLQVIAQGSNNPPKPTWMIKGTCGGCEGFKVTPEQKDLSQVKCSNHESVHFDQAVGMLSPVDINGCANYEPKQKAPEGFVLV
jgi:predicted metal-binding protein